ncbi:MAG: hypothetical protein ACI8T1_003680 [Verrucomicrobiales bacterium]
MASPQPVVEQEEPEMAAVQETVDLSDPSPQDLDPEIFPMDVIEIRPAEPFEPEVEVSQRMSLGEWDEPEYREVPQLRTPVPTSEPPTPEHSDELRAELDVKRQLEHTFRTLLSAFWPIKSVPYLT